MPNKDRTLSVMPAKNALKVYIAGDYYHLYNRGVEKRKIFMDHQDYVYFLHLLKRHLDPTYEPLPGERRPRNLSGEVRLNAYCLMPNHAHLLINQITERGIEQFSRSIFTAYSMYFNYRHDRVGSLFQDCYKAVRMERDSQFDHIVNYIHANPGDLGIDPSKYSYSSIGVYAGERRAKWLHPLQGVFLQGDSLQNVKTG